MNENVIDFHKKLPRLIEDVIAPMGRYQYAVVFMLCFNNVITAIATVVATIYTIQPDFSCGNRPINSCYSYNCTFGRKDQTIVSDWSLICERSMWATASSSFYFVGLTIGAFVGGIISDRYGRKPTLLFCLYAQGVVGVSLIFAPSVEWFIFLRALQGFFVQGMQTVVFSLMMEYCKPSRRTMAGMFFELMWATGFIFLGAVAYTVPNWRDIQKVLAIPTIITIFWTWLIPESMHWLYTNRKENLAFEMCVRTARYNKNYGSVRDDHHYWKEHIKDKELQSMKSSNQENKTSLSTILKDIFKTPCLKKHIFIMASTWFAVAMSYYGLLFFIPTLKLSADPHLHFIFSGVIEFFVYIVMYFVLAKFGRRKPLMIYLFMNAVLLVIISVCISCDVEAWINICIALLARATTSSIFYGIFVQANELFPTVNRGCAFGICGFMARFGGIISPFLSPLAQQVSPILPMTILGILSILAGMAQYFLPETLNIKMPNSVEDAKRIWE